MTALAAFFALLPMALGLARGSEANTPLGRAVIGGLLAGLVTTLFVVPALYSLVVRDDRAAWPRATMVKRVQGKTTARLMFRWRRATRLSRQRRHKSPAAQAREGRDSLPALRGAGESGYRRNLLNGNDRAVPMSYGKRDRLVQASRDWRTSELGIWARHGRNAEETMRCQPLACMAAAPVSSPRAWASFLVRSSRPAASPSGNGCLRSPRRSRLRPATTFCPRPPSSVLTPEYEPIDLASALQLAGVQNPRNSAGAGSASRRPPPCGSSPRPSSCRRSTPAPTSTPTPGRCSSPPAVIQKVNRGSLYLRARRQRRRRRHGQHPRPRPERQRLRRPLRPRWSPGRSSASGSSPAWPSATTCCCGVARAYLELLRAEGRRAVAVAGPREDARGRARDRPTSRDGPGAAGRRRPGRDRAGAAQRATWSRPRGTS